MKCDVCACVLSSLTLAVVEGNDASTIRFVERSPGKLDVVEEESRPGNIECCFSVINNIQQQRNLIVKLLQYYDCRLVYYMRNPIMGLILS